VIDAPPSQLRWAGGDGTTRINLRGLGASRTLVLLNGWLPDRAAA
jgi:hypothetical protein